ncbi:MAG: polysaccharide export protein [Alphaproteobacteria bacterium]|nr:polysaccharide export protein [Alphaproteobacteria bacterium]
MRTTERPGIPPFLPALAGIVLGCLAVLMSVLWAPASAQPAVDNNQYTLGPGDEIRVTVFGEPDLSGQFKVGSEGTISLPLIGQVAALGRTTSEIEKSIVDKLSPDYVKDPNVSIEVLTYRPFFIMGEVNKPGSYAYVNGMTVLEAVALAGGFTYRAKTGEVYIKRTVDGNTTETLEPVESTVLPGDVIRVRERYF